MLLKNLWYYIMGYIEIEISGVAIERFINLTLRDNVLIWDIENYSRGLKAKIKAGDFSQLRKITKSTKCKVKIINRYGLPFIFLRLKERKILAFGLFLSILALLYLSAHIWFVDIEGNERISNSEIASVLRSQGLEPGVKRANINPTKIEDSIKAEFDQILWAGVELTGTRALISVTEKEEDPDILEGPTNIVAVEDAYIIDTMIFSGYPAIEAGDIVRAGDILVYGRVVPSTIREGKIKDESELLEYPKTQAKGLINGRIHHISYGTAMRKEERFVKTGEQITNYGLSFNGFSWSTDLKDIPYVEYDREKTIRKYELPLLGIDVELKTETLHELDKQIITRDNKEAKRVAQKKAITNALQKREQDQKIVNYYFRTLDTSEKNRVAVQAILTVETSIGKEVEVQ